MERYRRSGAIAIGILCGTLLLAQLMAGGCGRDEPEIPIVLLSEEVSLHPPTELVRTPSGNLVALVAEGEDCVLTLYRSGPDGQLWRRWQALPAPEGIREVDLSVDGNLLVVAGNRGQAIWISTLAIDPQSPEDSIPSSTELPAKQTVVSLAIAAIASVPDEAPELQLAYLVGDPADSQRVMMRRWSLDGGVSWSEPRQLGEGILGRVALETRPSGGKSADLCFSREGFLRWRGLSGSDRTDEFRITLRVAPDSRNEIARMGLGVLVVGESARHQVVASASDNSGRNWSAAMALARNADHPRVPDIDAGFGRYWVTYSSGDTTLAVRTATDPSRPTYWSRGIYFRETRCLGEPSIVALPDSSAGLLFAVPDGKVYFARVTPPQEQGRE
ncbi:MAG: hypothetical protein KAY24_18390 [Candidatus Eisenbacteria sp.]|nr:hypothetical protein [Candidatus Eisenbacteria bacterium]